MEFQPWKDYFQLSSLVKEMARMNTGKPQPAKPLQINRAALTQCWVNMEEANYGAASCLIPFADEPPVMSTPPDSYYEAGLTSSPNLNLTKPRIYQYPPKTLDKNFQIEPGLLAKTSQIPPASSSPTKRKGQSKNAICHFCKHNGEAPHVYSDHNLKDERGKVICPVLRMYICSLCGATGESSHTRKYCPLNKNKDNHQRKTERNSAGHRMKH